MDTAFYDRLAPDYHLLYPDWERAVARQGAALATVLRAHGVAPGDPVLDAACGIGTQTLGLIAQGFALSASDLSPGAVTRPSTRPILPLRCCVAATSLPHRRRLARRSP